MTEPSELAQVFRNEFIKRNKPCAAGSSEIQELVIASREEFHPSTKWKFKFVNTTQVIKAINSLKKDLDLYMLQSIDP